MIWHQSTISAWSKLLWKFAYSPLKSPKLLYTYPHVRYFLWNTLLSKSDYHKWTEPYQNFSPWSVGQLYTSDSRICHSLYSRFRQARKTFLFGQWHQSSMWTNAGACLRSRNLKYSFLCAKPFHRRYKMSGKEQMKGRFQTTWRKLIDRRYVVWRLETWRGAVYMDHASNSI